MNDYENRLKGLACLLGNTPLLDIKFKYKGTVRHIYAKAENLNMTGSIKDRMAFSILQNAFERKEIVPESHIIEATSGNTGISFSALGKALGHQVTIFMPDWMSPERINLIKSLGAEIHLVSKEQGGFQGSIRMSEELAKTQTHAFLPNQFSNEDNCMAHYNTTGPEIWWQLRFQSLTPDAFIAGVGTGGTIMGTGKYLKEQNNAIKIYPLEPSNSPTLTTGHKVGKHRIQGISDEFIPSILELNKLDEVISVDDGDAIIMAQKLANQLGIGVGISSGANLLGALIIQEKLGKDSVVVTVFPDDNKKYLSTDLLKTEPIKQDFLSPDVDLISYKAHKRVCHTCCDPEACLEKDYSINDINLLPHCPRRTANCNC
ncbi:MAG: cysteine synthase family protein [Bacteroidetes bacterium]|jgi:cysteine synthase|nr:cysteine synthase family protein [Bacteroidota bacterium]MBT5529917.1 cysteine synthase family protein [Cytophagia bacterium]MBT3424008.1 cysteine synthase family protein [Bacteroidota bacterium]MBT3799713.1 cysteine synthase family protein [Bacteroidota bacterium]MBT3935037.1 cysteine synthase family protein [Bacteroidota bacterium]